MAEANFDYCSRDYSAVLDPMPGSQECDWETIRVHAGNISQLDILELGCGEGRFLRHLRRQGAQGRLLGVDLSENMLAEARKHEQQERLNIEFRQADATQGEVLGEFDLVLAPLLFSLARNRVELEAMFRTAANNLSPNGRLLIYDDNLFLDPRHYPAIERYGWSKWLDQPEAELVEGTPIHFRLGAGSQAFQVTATYLPWEAWQSAATSAGLSTLEEQPILLSEAGRQQRGLDFWRPYMELPLAICLTCRRLLQP